MSGAPCQHSGSLALLSTVLDFSSLPSNARLASLQQLTATRFSSFGDMFAAAFLAALLCSNVPHPLRCTADSSRG